MSVKLRRMRRSDIPAVVAIIAAHDKDDGRTAATYFSAKGISKKAWTAKTGRHWVAVDSRAVVGMCGAGEDDEGGHRVWWLGWFYVAKGYRGNGVGNALFQRAVRHVRERRGRKLFIDTGSGKAYARARKFYLRQGAVEEGLLRDFYGKGDHMVLYGLPLRGKAIQTPSET
jgi:GNAT superfamily N-acetyltransferase